MNLLNSLNEILHWTQAWVGGSRRIDNDRVSERGEEGVSRLNGCCMRGSGVPIFPWVHREAVGFVTRESGAP
jgi:hypothetical protein